MPSAFSLRTSYISNTSDKAGWNNLKCAFSGIFQNEYLALESVSVPGRSLCGAHGRQARRKQQPGHLWRDGPRVPKVKYCLKSPMNGLSDLWLFKSKARKGFHATTLPGAQKRLPGRLGTYWGAGGGRRVDTEMLL